LPLYEYECRKKGHRFELIRKFSDPPVEKCIKCGSAVQRLLSAPAIAFKGEGWYVTDYARKGSNGDGSGAADKDSGSKAEASAGSAGASKKEPKKEAKKSA
jgi:putative FmdB family regulatory protein